jgi:hypothetical protein
MLLNKVRSSSEGSVPESRKAAVLAAHFLLASAVAATAAINLSPSEAMRIGRKIWQNECNGTVAGLTAWNSGENFASLGIGHFIWYPKGQRGPFEESFPKFLSFAGDKKAPVPVWVRSEMAGDSASADCPWNSRAEFNQASQTVRMKELRQFLVKTVDLQAAFMVERLQQALPKMLAEAPPAEQASVRDRFDRVADSPGGCYALVDYVNFKGEGTLATERYEGQGWGLLQVLEGMPQESNREAVNDFADSAKRVLTNRVRNSPPERNESRWLPGWLNRINTYRQS